MAWTRCCRVPDEAPELLDRLQGACMALEPQQRPDARALVLALQAIIPEMGPPPNSIAPASSSSPFHAPARSLSQQQQQPADGAAFSANPRQQQSSLASSRPGSRDMAAAVYVAPLSVLHSAMHVYLILLGPAA